MEFSYYCFIFFVGSEFLGVGEVGFCFFVGRCGVFFLGCFGIDIFFVLGRVVFCYCLFWGFVVF